MKAKLAMFVSFCLFLLPWLSWMPGNINLSALDAFFANDKDFLASKA